MIRELVLSATINFDKKMLEAIFDWSQIGRWSRSFIKYFVLLQRKYSYTGIAYRVMTLTEKDAKILKAKKNSCFKRAIVLDKIRTVFKKT